MSEPVIPAEVQDFLDGAAKTFTDLGAGIGVSAHPEPWKGRGVWAAGVLADVLGDGWPGAFQQRCGQPYLSFALAATILRNAVSLTEFAAGLRILDGSQGLPTVVKQLRSQYQPGVPNSARLQVELAVLEKRRSGSVSLEVNRGPGQWQPDVMLGSKQGVFGVECLYLSTAEDVLDQFRNSAADGTTIDGWRRIGARLATKAGQPAQDGGWLRCHLDDGMFSTGPLMTSDLMAMPLDEKVALLAQGAREQMAISGDIHGVVFSGLPARSVQGEETCRLPDGPMAFRRILPGDRVRETFVIPNAGTADTEREAWFELYDQEPSWLDWALGELNVA